MLGNIWNRWFSSDTHENNDNETPENSPNTQRNWFLDIRSPKDSGRFSSRLSMLSTTSRPSVSRNSLRPSTSQPRRSLVQRDGIRGATKKKNSSGYRDLNRPSITLHRPSGSFMEVTDLNDTTRFDTNLNESDKNQYTTTKGGDVTSVPYIEDCNLEERYSIAFSQDGQHNEDIEAIEKLHALRDMMGKFTNGQIDRQTFSKVFCVNSHKYDCYDREDGMIDGYALLMDTIMGLKVDDEEKLRFIFDTIDINCSGFVTQEQMTELMKSNFKSAKVNIVGTDLAAVTKLMFEKAGAEEGKMTYDQFKLVLRPHISGKDKNNIPLSIMEDNDESSNKFDTWYETNKLHFWWLVLYVIANNVAFWVKWHLYEVDPALGYGLRIARSCAQVVMLNLLLVLLPMCRSITAVMKRSRLLWKYIPFDYHIEFHMICGTVLLTAGLIHTLAHVSNEIHLYLLATPEEISQSIFITRKVPGFTKDSPPAFIHMLVSLPVWTGVILLLVTLIAFPLAAIPKFRQGNFNLFWFSHMLFGPFLFVMCFHGANSWLAKSSSYLWVTPPFLIYLIERRFRYAKVFSDPVRIMEAFELDNTVAIFMEKPKRFEFRPGMYLYICVPAISSHEWHPFTISSAPGDNYLGIHVRNGGDWTKAFNDLITQVHENQMDYPDVYLDGPVGAPTQDYFRYSTLMCVAGGIGVTPFASIMKDVVHLWEGQPCHCCDQSHHVTESGIQKLYFHWITRDQESLGWFEGTMNEISNLDKDNIIEAHQYLSSVKGRDNRQLKMFQDFVHKQTGHDIVSGLKSNHLTHFGRPNWEEIFASMRHKHPDEVVGVFYCGPLVLEKILQEACIKYSSTEPGGTFFDFHAENFS